jgi:hypothetical protein
MGLFNNTAKNKRYCDELSLFDAGQRYDLFKRTSSKTFNSIQIHVEP